MGKWVKKEIIMSDISYKSAGVDIEAGNEAVELIKSIVKSTFSDNVLTGIGNFGSLYDLKPIIKNYKNPVMVQSIDGVGTKTIIARIMNKYDTVGIDLLSAASNDIIVMGAKPLTFLDYIANDKLDPKIIEVIVAGMAKACRENKVSLVGGETAEMPDVYLKGEHDLVGIITGMVEKEKIIDGSKITDGEVSSTANARLIRDGSIIYTGKISTIFREKNQVKTVEAGQECGITLKDFNDFKKKDIIEAFSSTSTERMI